MKTIRNLPALATRLITLYGLAGAQQALIKSYGVTLPAEKIKALQVKHTQARAEHPADIKTSTTKVTLADLRAIWARGNKELKAMDGRSAKAKVIKAYLVKIVQQGQALKAQGA